MGPILINKNRKCDPRLRVKNNNTTAHVLTHNKIMLHDIIERTNNKQNIYTTNKNRKCDANK